MHSMRSASMRLLLLAAMIMAGTTPALGQGTWYLDYVGSLNTPSGTASDVWGWTAPNGDEYAVMGYTSGLFFAQTYPVVQFIEVKPGPTGSGGSIWRDFKTYGNYLYSVSEATGAYSGLSVYDMSYLPDSAKYLGSFSTNGSTGFTCHNLSIDVKKGFAYLEGAFSQQVRVMSLANPAVPAYVASFGTASSEIHDIFADNDTAYVAEGSTHAWSVWDMANKLSPQLIARVSVPASGYVHNIWPSEDRQYCVTSEETWTKTVKIWDISDLQNVQLISEYLAPNGMVHNAHWKGNFHINSHYEAGVQLVDVSDPVHPVELDRVDTYPTDDGHVYNGCWGAYPFTQNGYIYASNINDGKLWILKLANTCPLAEVPELLDPGAGETGVNQPAELSWESVVADSFDVQVDNDPLFGSPEIAASTPVSSYQATGLAYESAYHWRVRANNSCGQGDWTASQAFTTGCVIALTGDVNADGFQTSADIIYAVNYVFKSGPTPLPVEESADVNCSGAVASDDIVTMVNFTFKSGAPYCDACTVYP